ncbi:hypothetical protein QBC45DRAFT_339534, partial [Copromyces sp. CBS 386.78]
FIIKKANFNAKNLKIIKISVNRLKISIIIQPLFYNYIRDFRYLFFFIDKFNLSFNKEIGCKIVKVYNFLVRLTDKDIIYKDFTTKLINCCIYLATIFLGIGIDLLNIVRVI